MSATVRLVKALGPGVVVLHYSSPRTMSDPEAVWTRCRLRKDTTCDVTGVPLRKSDEAWRPVGNHDYRMRRISAAVIEELIVQAD